MILGRKVGMTRLFGENGIDQPVTVIQVGPCVVTQVRTLELDGYHGVQLGFAEIKGRSSTMPLIGHDAKAGAAPQRFHRELRLQGPAAGDGESNHGVAFELGQRVTAADFEDVTYVDVVGTSKGKGFQGAMKRHGFGGQEASHGVERKHRSPGSIGGRSSNLGTGKPKKGIRMSGHMGDERVSVRNLPVVSVDAENDLLLVKGPIPGPKGGLVEVRTARRLWKRKIHALEAAG
nr:50S ribosomal protein L3 [Phycisphaera mikurensis]